MTLLRTFIGMETAVLTFRTKQCSTCHSSHICYGKRFYNDFFLNHHTIALVNNCLIFLSCVIIKTALDLMKKKSVTLTVSFQLENVPFNIQSYHLNAMMQCMFTDNYDSSFCFWVFEKRLTQKNCFLFRKKYGLFNSFIFLTIKKFLLSYFPNFHGQRSGGTRS